tara:strand:+ start:14295 stop:15353 length:1059 start_codon:yes stop_codon:yes gene_type:complete
MKLEQMDVQIGKDLVGNSHRCFVALEPSATYRNFDEAKSMVDAVSDAGAQAIKFQTFLPGDVGRIIEDKEIMIKFGTKDGEKQESVFEALKRRELEEKEWEQLIKYTKEKDLGFITAPYFPETVDFLIRNNVHALKISKGDINNVLLIDKVAKTGLPIILDAREKLDEIDNAIKICERNNNQKIVILHCPSGYPAENSGINLRAIEFIKNRYIYPVGFADHSEGQVMNFAAIGYGATMIEKTITFDKYTENVEHLMSIEIEELGNFVKNVRMIDDAKGTSDVLQVSRVEETARRSIVSKVDIKKGQEITLENIDYKRPGNAGISCAEGFEILKHKAKVDIKKNTFIKWEMID